ncbi:MAG: hypothetical protein AAFQ94_12785 [Bacteroidota bacterium]
MNVERLKTILEAIQKDLKSTGVIAEIQNLRNHLQNTINQPQQPTHQQNLVKTKSSVSKKLNSSASNNFSPGWLQIIDEIGDSSLFGTELAEKIDSIFEKNQITPQAALTEIDEIVNSLTAFNSSLEQTVKGLNGLGIESDDLDAGECEIGYSIPRAFVNNKLTELESEIHELNFILNNISEVIHGEKVEYEVKTISSSDFLLYVSAGLSVTSFLGVALEKIITTYKTILEIKKLRKDLKDKGVPDKETKGIEKHANESMGKEIKKIVDEAIKEHYKEKNAERKNELTNGLTISLNKLSNRIDKGFNVEIRVKELPEPEEETELTEEQKVQIESIQQIQSSSKALEFIKISGEPILQLEEENGKK